MTEIEHLAQRVARLEMWVALGAEIDRIANKVARISDEELRDDLNADLVGLIRTRRGVIASIMQDVQEVPIVES